MIAATVPSQATQKYFECLWCHQIFEGREFTLAQLREGPRCLVCGEPLEPVTRKAIGAAEDPRSLEDQTAITV